VEAIDGPRGNTIHNQRNLCDKRVRITISRGKNVPKPNSCQIRIAQLACKPLKP
jgi:hypothetical protein